jgi:hypothetical protein
MANEQQLEALRSSLELTKTGFAGIDRNGNKVDRRENYHCVPLAKNSLLNIPAPRCLTCKEERTIEEIDGISCTHCNKEHERLTREVYDDLIRLEKEIAYKNKTLIQQCCKIRGKSFKRYLKAVMEGCEICRYGYSCYEEFKIVDTPLGEWQREDEDGFGSITGVWVEQWSVGMEGDSFSGHITVKIKHGMFLQMPFSC